MLSIPYFTCGYASAYPVAPPMTTTTTPVSDMTYDVYGVMLNLTQPNQLPPVLLLLLLLACVYLLQTDMWCGPCWTHSQQSPASW